MREDIRKLMKSAGWPEARYQDVAIAEQGIAVASAWPLIAAVNRRLPRVADADDGGGPERGAL
jgi:hypothetical protein